MKAGKVILTLGVLAAGGAAAVFGWKKIRPQIEVKKVEAPSPPAPSPTPPSASAQEPSTPKPSREARDPAMGTPN